MVSPSHARVPASPRSARRNSVRKLPSSLTNWPASPEVTNWRTGRMVIRVIAANGDPDRAAKMSSQGQCRLSRSGREKLNRPPTMDAAQKPRGVSPVRVGGLRAGGDPQHHAAAVGVPQAAPRHPEVRG